MADIKTFKLPDLGEGLPDATIVEWHVKEGDTIKLDEPLASMETAKAVVDVPSPYTGKVVKLYGAEGDVIETGAELADFEPDPNARQRAESQDTGHSHGPKKKKKAAEPEPAAAESSEREDEGTVVGAMTSGNEVLTEQVSSAGGVKAVPAVRAMARKLKVDLSRVRATGEGGVITLKDVKQAAADGSARAGSAAPAPAPAAAPGPSG
ncbi:MAG: biotin/lipoyl-containing protein, partial [Rhodanobacteraceae bacterium]